MPTANYYPPIRIRDEMGNTFEFRSELVVEGRPPYAFRFTVLQDGKPLARRQWDGQKLPLRGQLQNMAARFVKDRAYRERFLKTQRLPDEEEGRSAGEA